MRIMQRLTRKYVHVHSYLRDGWSSATARFLYVYTHMQIKYNFNTRIAVDSCAAVRMSIIYMRLTRKQTGGNRCLRTGLDYLQ